LEKSGIPTVVVTTTHFETLTRTVASSFGLPGARTVVMEHPLGGTAEDLLLTRADAIVDRVLELLTT
jgi:hypothetical protein